ncbi:MAG TPA: outer membrane protein assembly factor BamA [bacterium]|nr:outer membrane protein assembly factor BamA [bacterium]
MSIWGRINRGRISLACIAVLAALLFSTAVFALEPVVKEVDVIGNRRTPDETIKEMLMMRREGRLDMDLVDADIKRIYKLGQFQDVHAEATLGRGGVKLTYVVVEKPLISKISFDGNKKLKTDDLLNEVRQRTYAVFDEKSVAISMENIRAAYAKKGYYLADIDYHTTSVGEDEAELIFDIKENQGVAVRRIMFIGNKVFSDDELRDAVKTRQKGAFSFLTGSGKYSEEMLRNDLLFLTYFYLNHGYLKVKVEPPRTTISKDKRYIFVTFQVHEGEQYRIGDVSIEGDILTTKEELTSILKTKKGNIYSQQTLDQDIMNLTDRYGDEGYAYANIIPQTVPNDEDLTADLYVSISKGNRIKIEQINIYGNTNTRDKVIRREMMIKENDRYSERLVRRSKENLMRLGFFEEVNFATPRGSKDDTMILNVTVKERSTRSFNVGAGFSSVEKFIFNASVRLDNFKGFGMSTAVSAELSKIRQLFMLSVSDPYFLDTNWLAGFSVYRTAYYYTDFKREATGGDINFGHRFFDNFSANLGYQIEHVSVGSFSYAVPQRFREDSSGLTSGLNFTISRDTTNNRLAPTKGMYNALMQEVSGAKLGGNNDFYRVNFRTMLYEPVWKGIIFRQFFRMGYVKSLNDNPVPLYERFFTGGPNSLRGFYPNSVGPSLRIPSSVSGPVENFVYGGDKLMLFVTELEFPVVDKAGIRAVAFFDAGNAYAEEQNYSFRNIRMDYGFGIRWNSPMGPLRFEWGIPIQRRSGEDSVVFNFTIGNFF